MRNRILAGLGVAALATVGVAAPATAVSPTTADIWVVHAVPGVEVDVYINGNLAIAGFDPTTVTPLVDVAPGNYVVDIVPAATPAAETITPGTGLFGTGAGGAAIAANTSYTLVAHPDADGDFVLTPFVNDLSAAGAGNASVTVRHTAEAPAVNVVALPSTTLFPNVVNGTGGTVSVPAGTYDIQVQVAGSDPVVVAIDAPDTALNAGTHYFLHAYGPVEGAYSIIPFTIGDAAAGIPAGSAGLVADDAAPVGGFAAAGAAALLALLAAAGVVIMRRRAAAER
mgnify:FL=1